MGDHIFSMKSKDIKNKQNKELLKMLWDKQKELRLFRFSVAGSKAKDVKAGRNIKKDIARIMTEINTVKNN